MTRALSLLVITMVVGSTALAEFTLTAHAEWSPLELLPLVNDSDLIVVGTLRHVREYTRGAIDHGEGKVHVESVLWGDCAEGDSLSIGWQNESEVIVCSRVEHAPHEDMAGVWFLQRTASGSLHAGHTSCFQEVSKLPEIERLLQTHCLRVSVDWRPKEVVCTVVLRNPTPHPRRVPWFASHPGKLSVGPGAHLVLYDGKRSGAPMLAPLDSMVVDPALMREVPGRSELRFETRLSGAYDLRPRTDYAVRVEVEGASAPARADFRMP
jgi:hypothetical protein